tara:strand:+ start:10019 stop:10201 length:183 start_codon:yes stop_codon:yes gene_type:complete
MPTYKVYLINVHNYETTVVAKNEDEAMDKAQELDYDDIGHEVDTNGFEVVDVEYESNIDD